MAQERMVQNTGAFRRVLKQRDFRLLWVGQFISGIGDWLVIGFLMPLVTTLSGGSSMAVAGILIAKIIPALIFGSVLGVFVDRFDRRRFMIASDVIRSVLSLGLIFTNSLWVIYGVVLLMETAGLAFNPARNSLVPHLVDEDDLAAANGLMYTTLQASMLIGLTASGAILAVFEYVVRALLHVKLPLLHLGLAQLAPELLGPRAGVFLDSLTFGISVLLLWRMHSKSAPKVNRGARLGLALIGKDVREAFVLLGQRPDLRGYIITIGVAIFGGGAIVPVGLQYVQQNLVGGEKFLQLTGLAAQRVGSAPQTFMMVFLALGMALGAFIVPRLAHAVSMTTQFIGGVIGFGASMLVFALVKQYAVAGIFCTLAGFGIAVVTVAGNTYVAENTEDAIRGRIFTAVEQVIRVALLISMIVMAPIGDLVTKLVTTFAANQHVSLNSVWFTGSRVTLILASCIVLATATWAIWSKAITEAPERTPRDV